MSAEEISGRQVGLFAWLENRMIRPIQFRSTATNSISQLSDSCLERC